MKFDERDKALLRALQKDCATPVSELAARLGMAASTAWRRVQEFDARGVISRRVVVLDPVTAGVALCIFADVNLTDHSEEAMSGFARLVRVNAEIQECHKVTGRADYVLKIRVADVAEYEHFMTHVLLRDPSVRAVESSVSLQEIKSTTELPI